jgi:cytochrome c1
MNGLRFIATYFGLFGLVSAAVVFNIAVWGMHRYPKLPERHVPAAQAERGPRLVRDYGCIGCHTIPGVPHATGQVGPPLDRLSEQVYIAGRLPNSGQNLAWWIRNPREVDPRTAMPDLGVGERDARDIAAFLYSQSEER